MGQSRRGRRRVRAAGNQTEIERRRIQAEVAKQGGGIQSHLARSTTTTTVAHFSGPLPPPEVLQKFEEVVPGSAARIIGIMETEGAHRRSQEVIDLDITRDAVDRQLTLQRRGQTFAFIIAMTGFATAGGALVIHAAAAAATICGVTLATMVAAFLRGGKVAEKANKPSED